MRTEVLPINAASLSRAAMLLAGGEVVAFPTETVYGLGADATNQDAVLKIFTAKERPADNPLISHIDSLSMLPMIVRGFDGRAQSLADAFWPGPLTLVLPKGPAIADVVSAGLDTATVRMPAHPAALSLIRALGRPIAAPSANRSGRPSPTAAQHVLQDMDGRIPLILDGGPCGYGVESTVLDLSGAVPVVLRPGGVTLEMLRAILPDVAVDEAVLCPLRDGGDARSPGMRHRHYAPKAQIILLEGCPEAVRDRISLLYDQAMREGRSPAILCGAKRCPLYAPRQTLALGADTADMAAHLFEALRALDARGADLILTEAMPTDGMGLALMNRLLRAADFNVQQA